MKKYFIFLFLFIASVGLTQVSAPTNLSLRGVADWVRNFEFIQSSTNPVMPEVPTRGIQFIRWTDLNNPEFYVSNGSSWVLQNGRLFNSGSVEYPGLAFKNDEQTGISNPTSNVIAFSTGGVERMRLSSAGRLVLGSSYDNGFDQFQVTGNSRMIGNLVVTGTITGALQATGILGIGDGLTGNNYDGLTSTVWAVDFGTGSNQAARGNHTHAQLTRGVGLTGDNYNGSAGSTWAIAFGSTSGTVCEGNDSRLSDSRTPTNHDLLTSHTVSGLTTGHFLKATGSTSFAFAALSFDDLGVSGVDSTELGYLDGVTSAIQTQINGKQATITGAASSVVSSNLTASVALVSDASGKISNLTTVSTTELGYLDGVTSAIQTQINGKQATITGGATTITSSNLTASRALVSDSSGKVAVSAVTSTELGYVDGVTSAIQTQINGKANSSHTHGNITSSGAIGSTANLPIITTTSGVLTTGAFYSSTPAAPTATGGTGSSSNFSRGDHAHPSRVSITVPASPVNGDIWIE